ncbi:molybdate-anion transporter-like protein [Tanacetum coccineum]
MVTPGSDSKKVAPKVVVEYTVRALQRTMPPAVPAIVTMERSHGACLSHLEGLFNKAHSRHGLEKKNVEVAQDGFLARCIRTYLRILNYPRGENIQLTIRIEDFVAEVTERRLIDKKSEQSSKDSHSLIILSFKRRTFMKFSKYQSKMGLRFDQNHIKSTPPFTTLSAFTTALNLMGRSTPEPTAEDVGTMVPNPSVLGLSKPMRSEEPLSPLGYFTGKLMWINAKWRFELDGYAGRMKPASRIASIFLAIGMVVIISTWTENYGDPSESKDLMTQFRGATVAIASDEKIALLGTIQSLFEGSMYTFLFLWTPTLSPNGEDISHGFTFAIFMLSSMLGSSLASHLLTHSSIKVKSYNATCKLFL